MNKVGGTTRRSLNGHRIQPALDGDSRLPSNPPEPQRTLVKESLSKAGPTPLSMRSCSHRGASEGLEGTSSPSWQLSVSGQSELWKRTFLSAPMDVPFRGRGRGHAPT